MNLDLHWKVNFLEPPLGRNVFSKLRALRGGWPKGWLASTCRRPSALEHGSDRPQTLPKRVSDDPRQSNFRPKKFFSARFFRSRRSFFAFLARFWSLQRKTDLEIIFLAIFRSRWTYYELCTTKFHQKYVRRRPEVCYASTPTTPVANHPLTLGV